MTPTGMNAQFPSVLLCGVFRDLKANRLAISTLTLYEFISTKYYKGCERRYYLLVRPAQRAFIGLAHILNLGTITIGTKLRSPKYCVTRTAGRKAFNCAYAIVVKEE